MANKYGIGPGHAVFSGAIEIGDPDIDALKNMVIRSGFGDEHDRNHDCFAGLLKAYTALVLAAANEEDEEVELVSDRDTNEAEKLYNKYACAGYRQSTIKANKKCSDEDLYEHITYYTFPTMVWPAALLAELAFMRGSRDAKEAKAMTAYFLENQPGLGGTE